LKLNTRAYDSLIDRAYYCAPPRALRGVLPQPIAFESALASAVRRNW
jgi:hypothetical protein